MKKFVLGFLLLIILTGCGSKQLNTLDMQKSIKAVENKLSNMKQVKDSTLENVYNFDLTLFDEYVIKENEDGDMYAIIKTSNKTKVNSNMDEYFSKVREFNVAYSPERLEILDNRLKKEIGDYMIYIVAKDADSIYQSIVDTLD